MNKAGFPRPIFFLILLLCAGLSHRADADDAISFNNAINARENILIRSYFGGLSEKKASPDIASIDLNEDGVPEFIARTGCAPDAGCVFDILAQTDEKVIALGEIKARSLALGSAYSAGVRNIIAYNKLENDYGRALYIWDPGARRYKIKE